MTDTPAAVQDHYRKLLLARSGVDRLKMGAAMFDTARAFVRARVSDTDPAEMRVTLFLGCYRADFDPATLSRIAVRLRADSAVSVG